MSILIRDLKEEIIYACYVKKKNLFKGLMC